MLLFLWLTSPVRHKQQTNLMFTPETGRCSFFTPPPQQFCFSRCLFSSLIQDCDTVTLFFFFPSNGFKLIASQMAPISMKADTGIKAHSHEEGLPLSASLSCYISSICSTKYQAFDLQTITIPSVSRFLQQTNIKKHKRRARPSYYALQSSNNTQCQMVIVYIRKSKMQEI